MACIYTSKQSLPFTCASGQEEKKQEEEEGEKAEEKNEEVLEGR